jgi:hypothetical protein
VEFGACRRSSSARTSATSQTKVGRTWRKVSIKQLQHSPDALPSTKQMPSIDISSFCPIHHPGSRWQHSTASPSTLIKICVCWRCGVVSPHLASECVSRSFLKKGHASVLCPILSHRWHRLGSAMNLIAKQKPSFTSWCYKKFLGRESNEKKNCRSIS